MICYSSNNLFVWDIQETEEELFALVRHPDPRISNDRNKSHRLQTLAASAIVELFLDDEIYHMPNGRPYLKSGSMNISISNTGRYVAVLFGKGRVGVDIELVSRNASRIIGRVSDDCEIRLSERLFPENPGILLWCLKEASYKMIIDQPEGMALSLQHLVSIDTDNNTAQMKTSEGQFTFSFFVLDSLLVVWGICSNGLNIL